MSPSKPFLTSTDMRQAASALPDGPNGGPGPLATESAHRGPQEDASVAGAQQLEAGALPAADGGSAAQAQERDMRLERIRSAAYEMAARRGFEPGREVDDWLEAEQLVDGAQGGRGGQDAPA